MIGGRPQKLQAEMPLRGAMWINTLEYVTVFLES
jgi:hypothetical protein